MKTSKERIEIIQNYLADSNVLLENYHSKITTDCGRLGFRIIGTETKFNKIDLVNFLHSKQITNDIEINNIIIPKQHAEKIANSKKYESEILLNFMNMFSKIASKWSSYFSDVCLSKEDLESEAIQAAIYAIYGYANKEISISTYIYRCVTNKIKNICNSTNSLSNFGSRAIKIRRKFEEAKSKSHPFSTYDEIVKSLNLNEKEISILQSMSVSVCGFALSSNNDDKESSNDYSSFGKRFSSLDGSVKYNCCSNGTSFTIREDDQLEKENKININFSEFSELEKAVLEGFMNSSNNLGLSHFAKNLTNPRTGKPYSRMAYTYAWKRIKEKIKRFSSAA